MAFNQYHGRFFTYPGGGARDQHYFFHDLLFSVTKITDKKMCCFVEQLKEVCSAGHTKIE
jgi:hypothetical protein